MTAINSNQLYNKYITIINHEKGLNNIQHLYITFLTCDEVVGGKSKVPNAVKNVVPLHSVVKQNLPLALAEKYLCERLYKRLNESLMGTFQYCII